MSFQVPDRARFVRNLRDQVHHELLVIQMKTSHLVELAEHLREDGLAEDAQLLKEEFGRLQDDWQRRYPNP